MPLAAFMASQCKLTFAGVVSAGTLGLTLSALPPYCPSRSVGEDQMIP